MWLRRKTSLLLLAGHYFSSSSAIAVGDSVCIIGRVVVDVHSISDIDRRRLRDGDGDGDGERFRVLVDERPDDVGLRRGGCPVFRIDDAYRAVVPAAAHRALGGGRVEEDPETEGYRATIRGRIAKEEELEGADRRGRYDDLARPALLTDIEVLHETVGCDGHEYEQHPLCSLASSSTTSSSSSASAHQACPESLCERVVIDSGAVLKYELVPSNPPGSGNGLLCAKLEVERGGWIGLAVARDDGTGRYMDGAEAVIGVVGRGEDDGDGAPSSSVLKYDLTDAAAPMADGRQTLMNATVREEDDGVTVMEFAKLLTEDGEIPIVESGVNVFLHARGGRSLGHHSAHKVFEVDFAPTAPSIVPLQTWVPTSWPTYEPWWRESTSWPTYEPWWESTSWPTRLPSHGPTSESTEGSTTSPALSTETEGPTPPENESPTPAASSGETAATGVPSTAPSPASSRETTATQEPSTSSSSTRQSPPRESRTAATETREPTASRALAARTDRTLGSLLLLASLFLAV